MTNLPAAAQPSVDLTVTVTCFNEERFIADTIATVVRAARAAGVSFEVLVIDDVSRDRSVDRIREYLRDHPAAPVTLVENRTNQGLARNFLAGARLGRGVYYRLMPGDDAEPLRAMTYIFKHVGCADLVVPVFYQDAIAGKSPFRRRLSKLFTFLVNLLSGFHLDYYNGLPVFRREHVLRWPPATLGFGFQADILTRHLGEGVGYLAIPVGGIVEKKGAASTALQFKNIRSILGTFAVILGRRLRRACRRSPPRPKAIVMARPIEPPAPEP